MVMLSGGRIWHTAFLDEKETLMETNTEWALTDYDGKVVLARYIDDGTVEFNLSGRTLDREAWDTFKAQVEDLFELAEEAAMEE
jgi:biotin synthase-related radical SAM superfamily protein